MGDALMQVLDIAQSIQADNAATPDATAPSASAPRPSAAPGASASPAPSGSTTPGPVDQPNGQPLVAAILLSDGANSVGDAQPLDAAKRAATLGVPIYTIALGTQDGQVQVTDDTGQEVTLPVPPDTQTLQQIAEITGGQAFDAPTADQLSAIYDNLQSRIGYTNETQEVTAAFAAAGLLLIVVGAGFAALWFGRLP